MTNILSLSYTCESLDEFVWDMRSHGIDLTAFQLDRGVVPCSLQAVIAPHCRVMRFDVGNRVHHMLGVEPGYHTFGLLACKQTPSRIGRHRFAADSLVHLDPDLGLEATIESGFSGFTLAVAHERLRRVAELYGLAESPALTAEPGQIRQVPLVYRSRVRQRLKEIMRISREAPNDQSVAVFFEEELPSLIVQGWCLEAMPGRDSTPLSARTRAFRRATEVIRSSGSEIRTIEQLCTLSASSYSTLERAFREATGVTPKRYLNQSRLSRVRQQLLQAEQDSITEIAHHWGFVHMGKFAADYRQFFGELPSQTLGHRKKKLREAALASAARPQDLEIETHTHYRALLDPSKPHSSRPRPRPASSR